MQTPFSNKTPYISFSHNINLQKLRKRKHKYHKKYLNLQQTRGPNPSFWTPKTTTLSWIWIQRHHYTPPTKTKQPERFFHHPRPRPPPDSKIKHSLVYLSNTCLSCMPYIYRERFKWKVQKTEKYRSNRSSSFGQHLRLWESSTPIIPHIGMQIAEDGRIVS